MANVRTQVGSGIRPIFVVAFLAVEAAIFVVAFRPGARHRDDDDQPACQREHEEARALAEQIQSLRAHWYDTNLRTDPRPPVASLPEAMAPPSEREAPVAGEMVPTVDDPISGIAEVQARETPDPGWAIAAEARLRNLARSLGPAATVEKILCSGTLCRVELAHGAGALPDRAVNDFIGGANDLMPQVMLHPSADTSKTTLVFARAGNSLPSSAGGGG